jgi:hypothetical protein
MLAEPEVGGGIGFAGVLASILLNKLNKLLNSFWSSLLISLIKSSSKI